MKKLLFTVFVFLLIATGNTTYAQYHITSHSCGIVLDSMFCIPDGFTTHISGYTSGLTLKTYFGDGTSGTQTVTAGASGTGIASFSHGYTFAGTYTVKEVLFLGSTAIDSVSYSQNISGCRMLIFKTFLDSNGNCLFDNATEHPNRMPLKIAIDSNGYPFDTFITISGVYYSSNGHAGTVYKFTIITPGITMPCASGGVIYDTLSHYLTANTTKFVAVQCSSTGYDAAVYASNLTGRHSFWSKILASSTLCSPTGTATVTMHLNPKYNYVAANPTPTSVTGHTLVWNLNSLSINNPAYISVHGEVPGSWLTIGDTVLTSYSITPTAGDLDTTNNEVVIIDTVTGSFDPNDKDVMPKGLLPHGAGTKLTYAIRFENTGNDTAFNIHILDTLSNYLDARSLEVLGSSAAMNLSVLNLSGQNVVKFDFPGINLLDSSHHGLCDGMVMFTIKTRDGLPSGTQINNRAGIYFDYNDVVLTNTTTNTVASGVAVMEMSNALAELSIYPNPADDQLYIHSNEKTYRSFTICNSMGATLISDVVNGQDTKINIKALPAGVYYIRLTGDSNVVVKQFVKM